MKYYGRMLLFLLCAIWMVILSGCGETKAEVMNIEATVTAMEASPVTEYDVPRYVPGLMVDREGYSQLEKKKALFMGENLPGEFRLMEDGTDLTVFTGELEDIVFDEEAGLNYGYVDFSDFQVEGSYYLECDGIGQSYRFHIRNDMYAELFYDTYRQVTESCTAGTLTTEEAITLLEVYEWYPETFSDADSDKVQDVLSTMKEWTAYKEEKGVEQPEEMLYSAFLAKLGFLYKKVDAAYAAECLKKASGVFEQAQKTDCSDSDRILALTELYRATGLNNYGKQIAEDMGFQDVQGEQLRERSCLYAVMTYMSTRRNIHMEMCENMMNRLMEEAEKIAGDYSDMLSPITTVDMGQAEILGYATEVSCANYIMNNYQYTGVTEDFLHYLMGRNGDSTNYYAEGEYRTEYLLLLAPLVEQGNEKEQEKEQEGK